MSAAGLILFAAAFAVINSELLIHAVLYRIAANDSSSAITAFGFISAQALLFLLMLVFLTKWPFRILILGVAVSTLVNITYADILGEAIDPAKVAWMMEEARQSSNAAGQFAGAVTVSVIKMIVAIGLLCTSRLVLRPLTERLVPDVSVVGAKMRLVLGSIVVGLFFTTPLIGAPSVTGERSAFVYALQVLTAQPPPSRAAVKVVPDPIQKIEKILWLIDESISHDVFERLIKPELDDFGIVDLGSATSLGNCSTPANVALRSGVNVETVDGTTDLRATPSIWQYARKAGFETMLIDGQVSGPPQNMLLAPERALIDVYRGRAGGFDTDRQLAEAINQHLRAPGKQFIYAVLRGVHFQYTDHYPEGSADKGAPLTQQYDRAVAFSKKDVFKKLLADIDHSRVAIIYTSDHGQNVKPNVLPHCSNDPGPEEFAVPLAAFLPDDLTSQYQDRRAGPRSASQIFPTTLTWMGYSEEYAEKHYDHRLALPSKRLVWFGRNIIPVNPSDQIDVNTVPTYQAMTSK